jgi:hypothetical protein
MPSHPPATPANQAGTGWPPSAPRAPPPAATPPPRPPPPAPPPSSPPRAPAAGRRTGGGLIVVVCLRFVYGLFVVGAGRACVLKLQRVIASRPLLGQLPPPPFHSHTQLQTHPSPNDTNTHLRAAVLHGESLVRPPHILHLGLPRAHQLLGVGQAALRRGQLLGEGGALLLQGRELAADDLGCLRFRGGGGFEVVEFRGC